MNPKPTGHIVQRVHVNSAGLDDGELAHRARVTWRCGVCGATITDEDPSGLRHRAAVHRGLYVPIYRNPAEMPSRESGTGSGG